MVKLYEGGAYLLHGTEVIADAPDALAAVKSKTGNVVRSQLVKFDLKLLHITGSIMRT